MGVAQRQVGRWTYRPAWGAWLEETFETKELAIEHAKAQGWKTIDMGIIVRPDPTAVMPDASNVIETMLIKCAQDREHGMLDAGHDHKWLQDVRSDHLIDLSKRVSETVNRWLVEAGHLPNWRGIVGKGTVYILDDGSVV